jgi:hypothetical protein
MCDVPSTPVFFLENLLNDLLVLFPDIFSFIIIVVVVVVYHTAMIRLQEPSLKKKKNWLCRVRLGLKRLCSGRSTPRRFTRKHKASRELNKHISSDVLRHLP